MSVPNLKSFGPTKTELQAKEVGEFSITLYYYIIITLLPTIMAAAINGEMEIFKTLNNHNFCIYWCINLKLAEIYQNGVFTLC